MRSALRFAIACVLVLFAIACTPRLGEMYEALYPEPRTMVEQTLVDVCGRHGAICVLDPSVDNGLAHHGTYDYGVVKMRGALIRINPEFCSQSKDLCVFLVLHEIGHREENSDQTAADCWAARWATDAQVQVGVDQLRKWRENERADRLERCAK